METPADLQSEWARLVIGSLVAEGVRHAVISPGSRSAPFVIAALDCAGLEIVSAIDERSAAHFALGQARVTGRPSLLICTSGSAPANYFPAVVEAFEGGVPLVVLSADRPPELHGRGANQTTDQIEMYGTHARFFANLGEPRGNPAALGELRDTIRRAVATSTAAAAGPVHLNAQARKPLERSEAHGLEAEVVHARVDGLLAETSLAGGASVATEDGALAFVRNALVESARAVILCGPGPVSQAEAATALGRIADRTGAPVLAEAASQFRFGTPSVRAYGAFDALWSTEAGRSELKPDFVLQLGNHPVSKGWSFIAGDPDVRRVVVHPYSLADPSAAAERTIASHLVPFVSALAAMEYPKPEPRSFAARFAEAEAIAWDEARSILAAAGDALTEAAVAPTVVQGLPPGAGLVVGNSLPIRDVDRWAAPCDVAIDVFAQRGVSGIDGLVASAAGIASCRHDPTALLVGDISFLHDVNGLELASRANAPLAVIVLNNGGGRIFEQLPIADRERPDWLPYFTTPRGVELSGAAALYGCGFASVQTVSGLRAALASALEQERCTVIEARVPPDSAKLQGRELLARIERRLRTPVP